MRYSTKQHPAAWAAAIALGLLLISGAAGADDPAGKAGQPKRWALLIGVNKYSELQSLRYCRPDAEELSRRLAAAGFAKDDIFLLADGAKDEKYLPFKTNIERQLELVLNMAEPDDLVLVSFSGHGVYLDKTSYLCPREARIDAPKDTMVPIDLVYSRLEKCKARWKLLLVDACRNDPRMEGTRSGGSMAKSVEGFAQSLEKPPQGILALTSCAVGETSMEDAEFGHGIFVHFLLEGLTGRADREEGNRNGQISLLELYRYANVNTKRYVARKFNQPQTPILRGEIGEDYELSGVLADPRVAEALAAGKEHLANNRHDEAIAAFTEAIGLDQRCAEAYAWRGRAAWVRGLRKGNNGDFGQAILDLTWAIQLDRQADYYAWRSSAQSRGGDMEKAMADANDALQRDPKSSWAYISRGDAYIKQSQYDKAITDLNEAIRLDPKLAWGYFHRGVCYYFMKGEQDKAIADYTEAIRLDPKFAIAYSNRGACHHNKKEDYDKAIADYTEAIRLDPKLPAPLAGRGGARRLKGEYDRAIDDYTAFIRLDATNAGAYNDRGACYTKKGEHEKAIADYTEAIRIDPKLGSAYANRGLCYFMKGDHDKAVADFTEAIRLDFKHKDAYNTRGWCYYKKDELDKAIADYTEAIRIDPQYARPYRNRAEAYRAQGLTAEAEADERKAAELK